jgi:transposase
MSEAVTTSTALPQPPRSRAATRQTWVERLARFADSGLRPAQFCTEEGVSLPSFYAWKRRLATEALDPATAVPSARDPGPRLLPVRLPAPTALLELALPGGAVLRIPPGADLAWVRSLVEALGGTPC